MCRPLFSIALAFLLAATHGFPANAAPPMTEAPSLERLLRRDGRFDPYLASPQTWRLQILLGQIEPSPGGGLRLVQRGYRTDAEYFYPASSIKLFAAVAALQTLATLRRETGLALDENSPLVYHPLFNDEQREDSDPSHLADGKITIAHELRKLFLVSDNTAFNRLYELVGPDGLHAAAERAGLGSVRIVHRLYEARSPAENLQLPRIELVGEGFRHTLPQRTTLLELPALDIPGLEVGRGFLKSGERVGEAMNFSAKNRISLVDLQRALAMIVRPEVDVGGPGFELSTAHRRLLLDAMSQYPRESADPQYRAEDYPDSYGKFLLPGLLRVLPKERWKIYNKAGQAYGFSVENAYIVETGSGRAFFLAAVIYTNRDGILNDDLYEYQEEAAPFFANLGEVVARALLTEQ